MKGWRPIPFVSNSESTVEVEELVVERGANPRVLAPDVERRRLVTEREQEAVVEGSQIRDAGEEEP